MDKTELDSTTDPILFPLEILIEILSRLPAKPLVRFKCVSKQWSGLINSPYFIKLQMSQTLSKNSTGTLILQKGSSLYTLDFHNPDCHATTLHYPKKINLCEPDRLVGSCNGLLCFTFKDDHQLALYNPVTRAYKILPELPKRRYRKCRYKVELAYDRISDDYKVLCVRSEDRENYTLLYNLSNNAWEIILNPPWSWDSVKSKCVVVNNSFHWMDHELREIKCFDLFTRRYYEILLPDKINPGYKPTLAVLGGQLCVVTFYFDLWILKEYDVQESWTRIFRCSSSQWNIIYKSCSGFSNWRSGLSLACSKDGCKIFVAEHKNFICCDLESQEATMIKIPGLPTTNGFSTILPWVALLTPLE